MHQIYEKIYFYLWNKNIRILLLVFIGLSQKKIEGKKERKKDRTQASKQARKTEKEKGVQLVLDDYE